MFTPDVEKLLRRPKIEKPQEEFAPRLGTEEIRPADLGEGESLPPVTLDTTPQLVQELFEEAARVQELIDLVTSTAEEAEVTVPAEHQATLGEKISTQQYLESLQDPDNPNSQNLRQQYEWGLLRSERPGSTAWAILTLDDLHQLRSNLLNAAGIVEGTLLAATELTSGGPSWATDVLASHSAAVHRNLKDGAAQYRFQFLRSIYTAYGGLGGELFDGLLDTVTHVPEQELRQTLRGLKEKLLLLRRIFAHAQLLHGFEYFNLRDALTGLVEKAVLQQLLHGVTTVLGKATREIVAPILHFFEEGFQGHRPIERLGDRASQAIAQVVAGTCSSLVNHYNDLGADLLRSLDKENKARLQKLHVLGERNLVGRWIEHLDQALALIDQALVAPSLTAEIARDLAGRVKPNPPPPRSALLEATRDHPDLTAVRAAPLEVRGVPPVGVLET
jgi:hypothetical protein